MADFPSAATQLLSIVVVSYTNADMTLNCVHSIDRWPPNAPYEIFVIDNASPDGAGQVLTEALSQHHIIRNSVNTGFAAATNEGIRRSSGTLILLLNNDTVVHRGALDVLLAAATSSPDIGGVTCRLVDAAGATWHNTDSEPTTWNFLLHFVLNRIPALRSRFSTISHKFWTYDYQRDVPLISGACLLVKREVIDQVGLLDESYPMYVEDVDWCLRIRAKGWRLVFAPGGAITHLGGQSTTKLHRRYLFYCGWLRLSRQHYSLVEHAIPRLYWRAKAAMLGLALRAEHSRTPRLGLGDKN
jgi:GT2 family glycosyltransferase